MEQETLFKKGKIELMKTISRSGNKYYTVFVNMGPTYGTSSESFNTLEEAKFDLLNNYYIFLFGKKMTKEKLQELVAKVGE